MDTGEDTRGHEQRTSLIFSGSQKSTLIGNIRKDGVVRIQGGGIVDLKRKMYGGVGMRLDLNIVHLAATEGCGFVERIVSLGRDF